MRFPHNTKIFRGQLDAAPFLGVFFLLVIFLLLSSSLVFTPGVPIQLPGGADLPGTDKATLVVAVDRSGNFYFENQICDEALLKERLKAAVSRASEPLALLVKMDQDAKSKAWPRLGTLARSVGIRELVLAVQPSVVPVPAQQ
jgi:biopolymer transport protein ExbD